MTEVQRAAAKQAAGYIAALVRKGWSREAAESHPLVAALLRAANPPISGLRKK